MTFETSCSAQEEARAFAVMFYAALFASIFLVVGSVYFLSGRKQDRAPGLRHAMAIIALLIIVALFWIYRSRYGS